MTFSANESSVEAGRPVEIFDVVAGSNVFSYTSAEDEVVVGVTTYTPVRGLRRSPKVEGQLRRDNDFFLELPTSDPLSQLFTGDLPGFRVRLTVSKYHRGDTPTPEVVEIFDGFVLSGAFVKDGKVMKLTARPAVSAAGIVVPRRTFQALCNHVLFEANTCKVDDTDPTFVAFSLPVVSQVGSVLTVSGLSGSYADGFMQGGFVEVVGGSDFRSIRTHVGNVLTLNVPFSSAPGVVNVYAGCSHSLTTCGVKFDNVINYGGFPFVPTRNPFVSGIPLP